MPKTYKISSGKEHIIVTIDDGGAYIIKDMAGRKVFLSKYQAKLMKFGISSLSKESLDSSEEQTVKIEQI